MINWILKSERERERERKREKAGERDILVYIITSVNCAGGGIKARKYPLFLD